VICEPECLEIPLDRDPKTATDYMETYLLPQSQEGFYPLFPHNKLGFCLSRKTYGVPATEAVAGFTAEQADQVS